MAICVLSIALATAAAEVSPTTSDQQEVQARNLLFGIDGREDPLTALRMFRKIAETGHSEAQYFLGWLCWHGEYPPLSFSASIDGYQAEAKRCQPEGKNWIEKSAAQGEPRAKEFLAFIIDDERLPAEPIFLYLPSRTLQTADWVTAAAEAGNRDAKAERQIRENTQTYTSSAPVDQKDYAERMASANLENQYQIKRDTREGFKQTVTAIRANDPSAALLSARAIPWLRQAADGGDAEARKQWNEINRAMYDKPRDEYRMLKWVEEAAKRGDAHAQYDLGFLYASGRCMSPDVDEHEIATDRHARAYYWFEQARKGLPASERPRAETALAGLIVSHDPDSLAEIQNRARALHEVAGKPAPSKGGTRTYATRDEAMRIACDSATPAKWSGPWTVEGAKAHIGVLWAEGQRSACLGYLVEDTTGFRVLASTQAPAGFSARYNEYSSPIVLKGPPVVVHEQTLFFVSVTAMGMGGGGGANIQIWSVRSNAMRQVFNYSPESFTNVNTWDAACELRDGTILNGDRLQVRTCFDGKPQPTQSYRFDGEQFIQIP